MGSDFPLLLMIISFSAFLRSHAEGGIQSTHVLDLVIRDYTFKSLDKNLKTGTPKSIKLPWNLSGIGVDAVRFRCGSFSRYGARLKEFEVVPGASVEPCIERLMVIRQSMGQKWWSLYYSNYNLSGYQLVSPILGILAYNADQDTPNSNSTDPFQLGISCPDNNPIKIDFSSVAKLDKQVSIKTLMCASFQGDGRVTLGKSLSPVSPFVCVAKRHGHFGLITESPRKSAPEDEDEDEEEEEGPISKWKVAVGSTIGAALGAFLLGLLMVAMVVRVKKRSRMVEMERRAYEEEALQVSMVGHVRAPTASATRTTPVIEHHYHIPHR